MAGKLQNISELARQTARHITANPQNWASFLNTAARLYKYSFQDQLLIYAQRPDAMACAAIEVWNSRMNRWVKKGSCGIALLAGGNYRPQLKYVFDVSDTQGGKNAKEPKFWQLSPEYHSAIVKHLEQIYGPLEGTAFSDKLMEAAAHAAKDRMVDTVPNLLKLRNNSLLEELDELNVRVLLMNTLTSSIRYTFLSRCGIDTQQFVSSDDLRGIVNFNTVPTLSCLGSASARASETLLRQVETVVKQMDKKKNIQILANQQKLEYNEFNALKRENSEREDFVHGTHIHEKWGLSDTEPENRRTAEGPIGEIRNAAQDVFERKQRGDVHRSDSGGETLGASAGNRPNGEQPNEPDNQGTDETEQHKREIESSRSDALDTRNESHTESSGGNDFERADIQLSFFPAVEKQIEQIDQAKSNEKPFAFSILQKEQEPSYTATQDDINGPVSDTDSVTSESNIFPLPYKVGDTVYLDNKPFEITKIGSFDIQLRDPALTYPVFRSESRQNFEQLLYRDSRNGPITEFLAANMEKIDADFREALTSTLLKQRDKENIAGYFRENEGNTRISQRLSETYAGVSETIDLTTGETADIFATTVSFEVKVHNKYDSKQTTSWEEIAPVLRALYQQEQDGFSHDPVVREPENLEGKPSYQLGNHVVLEHGGHELSGTVGYVGEKDVRIDTGPYSWSQKMVNRNAFDKAIRQDKRNAGLFTPEQMVTENFHITDNHLGEGSAKTKYGYNIAAIRTMKTIEAEERTATPEEQEILSRYVGWGGLAQAFDKDNGSWEAEYAELKNLLSPDEYKMARASTLNAHYTSPAVIHAIYDTIARMGFTTGNILEPACGIGNFFGLLPESMEQSKLYGVELDSITGRIAHQLYPQANITVAGFETTDRRDFYDLAVGNVPFGQYKVSDKAYDKLGFSIHDYFFAKTLDQVRPGGVIAFITSRYTMDKQNPEVRRYISQRAELLGAVRLPNNAFKANAGTEVVSDILFLQKRERPADMMPDWVYLGQTVDGITINSYFAEHPEMVLGTTTIESTQYGYDATCIPIPGADLAEQLKTALSNINAQMFETKQHDLIENEAMETSIPADPNVRNFSYALVNGKIYYRENSKMNLMNFSDTITGRIRGMIELRDCTRNLIQLQLEDSGDKAIRLEQEHLNLLYEHFSKKYGLINSTGNRRAFEQDSSYCLLCSLEILDQDGNLERKADMFTKRTIRQQTAITSVETASEALAVSIGEKACVDMEYMQQLTGLAQEKIKADLSGVIFHAPFYGHEDDFNLDDVPKAFINIESFPLVTADEYLSGNVRRKLKIAEGLSKILPLEQTEKLKINVAALRQVQPKDLDASEISIKLGATWLDPAYIDQFMYETFDTTISLRNDKGIKSRYSPVSGVWNISDKRSDACTNVQVHVTYGTERINAYEILENTLNLKTVQIYDTKLDSEGHEHRVINQKETTLAQQKQEAVKAVFQDWIWKDPERREILCKIYNETFNCIRPREYDGSHIRFVGINPEFTLRPYQLNAVAHILYGGNTLLAHCVGAGKTFEMIAAAMESKRLGLTHKSLFVVPNHLTEQCGSDFLRLYPGANILVATKKDFEPQNRKKFCARIATGDYDAVVIGHSQFEKIPVSQERQVRMIENQISEIEDGIEQVKEDNGEKFTIKQMERTKKSLEARLERLNDDSHKDDVVTFEELGVDRLFVDEADSFKNLFLYTKMRNVAGIGQTEARKSSDMYMKCRYMDELTNGRGITFATGTPISNSMTELYTMMRYLQYDTLQQEGLRYFDSWAAQFGETVTATELAPEGTGFRTKTRFAHFFNLPELMSMWKEAADIQTADMLKLPVPEVEYINVVTQPSEFQTEGIKSLAMRADDVRNRRVDSAKDNMLKITNDGRILALDQRLMNPLLPDDPNSKVNACVKNILSEWKESESYNGAQLVFSDLSTPHYDGNFNIYDDIRNKLIKNGVPEQEIAFIHDAKTEVQKAELFAKVRKGQVRVLLGSTAKMGAGTNVQDLLFAEHHLDCPWKPRDIEQREGRIVRYGNKNPKVKIFRYVTEGTFDSYCWQLIENKQKFISQIMTSKSPARSCEDIDESVLSYAEVKALATGDPRIKEKMNLDIEVTKLKVLKAGFLSQHFRLEDQLIKYFPETIKGKESLIERLELDQKFVIENPLPSAENFSMKVNGKVFTDKKTAGMEIIKKCSDAPSSGKMIAAGEYNGFSIGIRYDFMNQKYYAVIKHQASHTTELGKDSLGNITRINNLLEGIPNRLNQEREELTTLHHQVEEAKAELNKTFSQEDILKEKSERLDSLTLELNIHNEEGEEQISSQDSPTLPLAGRIEAARQAATAFGEKQSNQISEIQQF